MNKLIVENLNYQEFKDFNIKFNNGYNTIISKNNCYNDTLFKILTTFYMTNNCIMLNDDYLNNNTRFSYLTKIGIIDCVDKNSFLFNSIDDELNYPLDNLDIDFIIKDDLKSFFKFPKKTYISELDIYEKQLLLVMLALLHEPKIIIMNDIFSYLREKDIKKLYEYIKEQGITVTHFISNLDDSVNSDHLYFIDNLQVIIDGEPDKLFMDDQIFLDNGFNIPFMADISNKLKLYGLIDKSYTTVESLVNDIWK